MKTFSLILLLLTVTALKPHPGPVRIFMAGDSTMADKKPAEAPETGWGQVLHEYFDEVEISNYALNGRSTKSFRSEGHWQKILDQAGPGDYVFIQFGHNDQKTADSSRYSPPQTDYRRNLARFVTEVRSRQAVPVLFTPVVRRRFNDKGVFFDTHGDYPLAVKELAQEMKVTVIDLHALSRTAIEQLGPEKSKATFLHFPPGAQQRWPQGVEDDTHFSPEGARMIAGLVADHFRKSGHPLASHLRQ